MRSRDDLDPSLKRIMVKDTARAFRYWVSQDPAARARYLHPCISLDEDDFAVDGEALPAFMAWLRTGCEFRTLAYAIGVMGEI
jgi:hypothetical protein